MSFLNKPIKSIEASVVSVVSTEQMGWYNPSDFPVPPGQPYPESQLRDFRWRVELKINEQKHSSSHTRIAGSYDGFDVTVGQWIANNSSGSAWQIIRVLDKKRSKVIVEVQDVFRYNTFKNQGGTGNGTPSTGNYVVFSLADNGAPLIDPVPSVGVSVQFTENLNSRFEYINTQYDYPLFQRGNEFRVNDHVAADSATGTFVKADENHKMVAGRVTSVSDTIPGWFTVNPVQKVVDFLDDLPGNIGDVIYTDSNGELSTNPNGAALYLKLRNSSKSITYSRGNPVIQAGCVISINGQQVELDSTSIYTIRDSMNTISTTTGVIASVELMSTVVESIAADYSSRYGEAVIAVSPNPIARINSVPIVVDSGSITPGYEGYARAPEIVSAINAASIPGIVAYQTTSHAINIENVDGQAITITNIGTDENGVPFAGNGSATGLLLNTAPASELCIKLEAIDGRAIDLFDVVGNALYVLDLPSVENGTKAAGLYIEGGLRTPAASVIPNLGQLDLLDPMIGDTAFVIDSSDIYGNNVNEWSMWLYDGGKWVKTSTQDSARSDAKSFKYMIGPSNGVFKAGIMSTGRRVLSVDVNVIMPYRSGTSLSVGYLIENPFGVEDAPSGLMPEEYVDMTIEGTYTVSPDIIFGTNTMSGDVGLTATIKGSDNSNGACVVTFNYI